jgi:ABC-type glycerol-3-phosphate transport system substrate-binding protein
MKNQRPEIDRRSFLKLLSTAGGAALLASCGAPATVAPTALPPTAVPPTPVPAGASLSYKGTLDLWDWEFPVRQQVFKTFIEQKWAAKFPDIKVNVQALPWGDMETKILAVASAKNGPPMSNVFFFWRYELERAGVINPFPEDFTDWSDRISSTFVRDEGKIRAIPSGWYMDMIYYNKEMLDKEGIKPTDIPTKWDDFIKLAKQLMVTDASGKITRLGCAMNDYWQHEYLWFDLIYQQGGWMYNEDGTAALWDQEPALNALQFIQDWYLTHKIDSLDFPVGYNTLGNEQTALFVGSGWNTGWLENDYPAIKDKYDTVPLPTLTGKPEPSYGLFCPEEGMQVFSYFPADVQQACTEFVKELTTGQSESDLVIGELCAPDSKKLIADPTIQSTRTLKAMMDTMPWRVHPGERPIEAEKLWRTMFDEVTLQKGDIKAAAQEATKAINIELPKKKRYFTERNYSAPKA